VRRRGGDGIGTGACALARLDNLYIPVSDLETITIAEGMWIMWRSIVNFRYRSHFEEARAKRAAKDAAKGKGKGRRGRKRKNQAIEANVKDQMVLVADVPEFAAPVAAMSEFRAPVARMI